MSNVSNETNDQSPVLWEVAYRLADPLVAEIVNHPEVSARREQCRGPFKITHVSRTSNEERQRIVDELGPLVHWARQQWTGLFDDWFTHGPGFGFSDGFAALFFIRVLWANQTVLLRGHYDSTWELQTTWDRAFALSPGYAEWSHRCGQQFLDKLLAEEVIESAGPSAVSDEQMEAILQHYGFPTDLLDFTYSYEVALYFAEGGASHTFADDRTRALGSLYAVPGAALPDQARLYTLPPTVLRPSLQRGVFIAGMAPGDQARLERFKFVFHHQRRPVWNSLGSLSWRSPVPLDRYLSPPGDLFARVAQPFLQELKRERERAEKAKGE